MKDEKKEAAYHEAGHAVLILHYGHEVKRIEISMNVDASRWDGKTQRVPKNSQITFDIFNPDMSLFLQECAIAFGGCLSQCKFLSRQVCPDTQFATDQAWEPLFEWMRHKEPETLDDFLIKCSTADSRPVIVPASPRSFAGADRTVFLRILNRLTNSPLTLAEILRGLQDEVTSAMNHLDTPMAWSTVIALAEALNAQSDNAPPALEGDELRAVLRSVR